MKRWVVFWSPDRGWGTACIEPPEGVASFDKLEAAKLECLRLATQDVDAAQEDSDRLRVPSVRARAMSNERLRRARARLARGPWVVSGLG